MHYLTKNLDFLQRTRKESMENFSSLFGFSKEEIEGIQSGEVAPSLEFVITLSNWFDIPIDRLVKTDLSHSLHFNKDLDIRFVVIDVDGVMTDGGMYFTSSGDEIKKFNTKDGMGIKKLIKAGFTVGIISSGLNEKLIRVRAEMLGIQKIYAGEEPKEVILRQWLDEMNLTPAQVAYIGDDINDIAVMKMAGMSACPADAVDEVKNIANIILNTEGGNGCVREWIDNYLLPANEKPAGNS